MVKRITATISVFVLLLTCVCTLAPAVKNDGRIQIPIVMYHSVTKTGKSNYIIPPDLLEKDFAYIVSHGYTAVFVRDVVNFVNGKTKLPKKSIVISFDDGFYNNLYYAVPLLEKYGLKATINVVGSYVDAEKGKTKRSCSYSYLNEKELAAVAKSGAVEIGNHSYAMHSLSGRRGVMRKKSETEKQYETALKEDADKCKRLIKRVCGTDVKVFAYPYGSSSTSTERILRSLGYQAILTCAEGVNRLKKGDTDRLYKLKRINRAAKYSTRTYFKLLGVQ